MRTILERAALCLARYIGRLTKYSEYLVTLLRSEWRGLLSSLGYEVLYGCFSTTVWHTNSLIFLRSLVCNLNPIGLVANLVNPSW